MLIYLDDINIYSKHAADHFDHLSQVLIKCREYGVSLIPKKCVFSTDQGKLLGHIVSRDGLMIDLERVEEILSLPLPSHKKGLQSFLGRINFVSRVIPDLASMLKPLIAMLKKNVMVTWTKEGKAIFEVIKKPIASAPTLVNPNFDKDFILYSLGGESSISVILAQLNEEDLE